MRSSSLARALRSFTAIPYEVISTKRNLEENRGAA